MLDAKWLDLLKASGSKTAAGAAAFGLLLLLNVLGWLPALDAWAVQAAAFGFLLCVSSQLRVRRPLPTNSSDRAIGSHAGSIGKANNVQCANTFRI